MISEKNTSIIFSFYYTKAVLCIEFIYFIDIIREKTVRVIYYAGMF